MRSAIRVALAVAGGYAAAAVLVVAGSAALKAASHLPAGGALPATYLAMEIAVGFAANVCAGYVCARAAPASRAVASVALLVIVGLVRAIVISRFSPPGGQTPGYLPLVSLLGVIGVWTGAMIERAIHS